MTPNLIFSDNMDDAMKFLMDAPALNSLVANLIMNYKRVF